MQDMHGIEGLEYCLEQVNSTNTEYGCRVRQVPTRALLTPRDRPGSQPVRHCSCTRDQLPLKKPPFRFMSLEMYFAVASGISWRGYSR